MREYRPQRKVSLETMYKTLPLIISVIFALVIIFPVSVEAADTAALERTDCPDIHALGTVIPCGDPARFSGWFLTQSLKVAGTAAVFMVTYGGYLIMRSQGDPENIQKGKGLVTNALIGLAFITFSAVILRFIATQLVGIPG